MALSEPRKRTAYEIAGVIYNSSATIHSGFGVEVQLTSLDVLRDALGTFLSAMDSDTQTKVEALCDEWDAIRLNVGSINSGNVGDIGGASYNFDEKRNRIKELFNVYIPVMHLVEAQKRKANVNYNGSTGIIPVFR